MYRVNTVELQELVGDTYASKTPLMVYGAPGIGKSAIMVQMAKEYAAKEKKKFIEWSDATKEEKLLIMSKPGDYFVYADQRVAQMDPTDLRGIPNMVSGTDYLETMPMSWVIYFTKPDANGIIFFDEINLAPPMVAAQAYQVINERTVADRRLSPNVHIVAAGNRSGVDKAFVFDMPLPLRDRFAEVEVYHDSDSWTKWASANKINPHLIAFIGWKESYLFKLDPKSTEKASTPRGITRASKLIGEREIIGNKVHQLVSISCGEAFATEFQAYVKHFAALNWNTIYSKPETVKDFEVDKLFAVVGGLSENYNKTRDQKQFDKTIAVILHMKTDFAISTLRMIKDVDFKDFKVFLRKSPRFTDIANRYGKFVID